MRKASRFVSPSAQAALRFSSEYGNSCALHLARRSALIPGFDRSHASDQMHRKGSQGNQPLAAGARSLEQDKQPMVVQVCRARIVSRTNSCTQIYIRVEPQRKIL